MDAGDPISYRVLQKGTPVESSDGQPVGAVKRVMEVRSKDVFDGIVIETRAGARFVDAPEVDRIYERLVTLKIDGATAARLPKPGENPAVLDVGPDDATRSSLWLGARRLWSRLLGR